MSGLKLLAIETSSSTATIALAIGDTIAERSIETPREQAGRSLGIVAELLGGAGIGLGDLDALVFGQGPGSFTGLRVAAAVARWRNAAISSGWSATRGTMAIAYNVNFTV